MSDKLGIDKKRNSWPKSMAKAAIVSLALCALAAPADAVTVLSGVVNAILVVNFRTAPAAGSEVVCGLALLGGDTLAPSDSGSVAAKVSGSTAVCKLSVPYKWRLESASSSMTIVYTASGPVQTSSATYEVITMPANGVVTPLTVEITQ